MRTPMRESSAVRRNHEGGDAVQVEANPERVAFRAFAFLDRADRHSIVDHHLERMVAVGASHGYQIQAKSLRPARAGRKVRLNGNQTSTNRFASACGWREPSRPLRRFSVRLRAVCFRRSPTRRPRRRCGNSMRSSSGSSEEARSPNLIPRPLDLRGPLSALFAFAAVGPAAADLPGYFTW